MKVHDWVTGLAIGMVMLANPQYAVAGDCDDAARQNRTVVRQAFEEAWNKGNFNNVATAIAADGKFHIRGRSFPHDIDSFRKIVASWRRAFPDFEFFIEDLVAQGDKVAARLRFSGTHEGKWREFEATGKRIEFTAMMFFRFENGKLVEIWEDFDEYGMRRQLRAASDEK